MGQKNLSQRQMRWLYVFNEFDFHVEYVPGEKNVLADSLSRIYSDDQPGTVRTTTEIIRDNDESSEDESESDIPMSAPVFVGRAVLRMGDDDETPTSAPRRSARIRGEPGPPIPDINLKRRDLSIVLALRDCCVFPTFESESIASEPV
ncbi:hypothetical protein AURDEDRAFT_174811 [Auricularia subglabra TFB-10046 SS5]|nr:hypothetical protein AURDEDRAFT_174811 [Auricularia subglabra TFB-10046 SS5]